MNNSTITNKILYWYDNNKRSLPWRKKNSQIKREYYTLVSEFMLQQTQVSTVIPYFKNFIKNIPNLESLANINEKKLLKYWEGLGYYSRVKNLKKTAKIVVSKYKKKLPNTLEELKTLPGIGDYTAGAILSIAFNKPIGIVCTTDQMREKNNIIDYINYPTRIFPIGRLDKPSEGLIFLTNDGDIVNKILRANNQHEKEYVVEVNKPVTKDFVRLMSSGVPVLDTVTNNCFVKQTDKKKFKIILTQGLNRQIRRMCEVLGYRVTKLKRIRIMDIHLDINIGEYRDLNDEEVKQLFNQK